MDFITAIDHARLKRLEEKVDLVHKLLSIISEKENRIMTDTTDISADVDSLEKLAAANNTELAAIAAELAAANTGNSPVLAALHTRLTAVVASITAADAAAQPAPTPAPVAPAAPAA
jgi:hypothetical protein